VVHSWRIGLVAVNTKKTKFVVGPIVLALMSLSMAGCPAKRPGKTAVFANQPSPSSKSGKGAPFAPFMNKNKAKVEVEKGAQLALNTTGHNSVAQMRSDMQKLPEAARATYEEAYRLTFTVTRTNRDQRKARDLFRKLVSQFPKYGEAFRGVGYTYVDDGFQIGKAIDWYQKSVKADPNFGLGHYGLAFLLPPSGKTDEGWMHFVAAMKSGTNDERNLKDKFYKSFNLKGGKTASAPTEHGPGDGHNHGPNDGHDHGSAEVLRLNSAGHNSETRMKAEMAQVGGQAAQMYEKAYRLTFTLDRKKREPRTARAIFAQIIDKNPKFGPAYRGLGYTFVDDGFQMGKAIDWYRQSVRADPKYGLGHYGLAFLLPASGKATEGFKHFQKAISLGIKDERNLKGQFYKKFNGEIAPHGGPN
jgi:tetratricopeptide (TPR) repeat protein